MPVSPLLFELVSLVWFITTAIFKSLLKCIFPEHRKCIKNDLVLITGGGKGIGKNIALELAKHSPRKIILLGRCLTNLNEVAAEVKLSGTDCVVLQCDVSKKEDIRKKAEEVKQTIGNVSILINNAGVVFGQDICDSDACEMNETLQVNSLAHFWTVKCFLPDMLENNRGHIVSINSILGLMGLPGAADYSASKFAVTGFMEALRMEISDMNKPGVFFTSVHPFLVNTDMFKGYSTRFPALFPALDQRYVAKKTVDAILKNQEVVIMPKLMQIFIFLKSVLPVDVMVSAQKFVGVDTAMKSFHRRVHEIKH